MQVSDHESKIEGSYEDAVDEIFLNENNRRWGKKDDIRAFRIFKSMIEEAGFTVEIFMKKVIS